MNSALQSSRKHLFLVIAICIPILALLLLEGALRVAGFGGSEPLFIKNPSHQAYKLPRPDIISRYFPHGVAPKVSLEPTFFLAEKPDDGFRVVVQGGSTAAGYPYGLGASLAGMLDQRLKHSMPEHQVEVINVAMSAVNSYFLLDTADEIIAQQPDAVVIYAGHNEYLGIFGVGSSFTTFQQPLLMRMFMTFRNLALFDAIQSAIQLGKADQSPASDRRTLMSQVARHKDIPFDSPMFAAGLSQFRSNLYRLLAKYKNAEIDVYISTIGSNLADHPPFSSAPSPVDISTFLTLSNDELVKLSASYQDSQSADFHFHLAQALRRTNQAQLIQRAKSHSIQAKEHDLLRFRAPEQINHIIRELAKDYSAHLVDANAALAQKSQHGIIGKHLMLEHLHPTLPGYFIIADAFYKTIAAQKRTTPFNDIPTSTAWQYRPITPAEEYFGFAQVKTLLADYPFTDSPTPVNLPKPADWQQALGKQYFANQIDWLTMMKALRKGYAERKNQRMYWKVTQLLADALPHDPALNAQVAEFMAQQGRDGEAKFYAARARR